MRFNSFLEGLWATLDTNFPSFICPTSLIKRFHEAQTPICK